MHRTHMRYLLVAGGALVIGLLAAGSPVRSLLPYLLLLVCPLSMIFMMRGMGGMRGGGNGSGGEQGGGCHGGHAGGAAETSGHDQHRPGPQPAAPSDRVTGSWSR